MNILPTAFYGDRTAATLLVDLPARLLKYVQRSVEQGALCLLALYLNVKKKSIYVAIGTSISQYSSWHLLQGMMFFLLEIDT
jgi:hypothetical protein